MSFLPANYDSAAAWKKVPGTLNYPDFITHLNYLGCLCHFSNNLSLQVNLGSRGNIPKSRILPKKVRLLELTFENIAEEKRKIDQFPDYSQICASWIPVKSYYLIFNLLMLITFLIEEDERWFLEGHKNLQGKFLDYLDRELVGFSSPELNQIYLPRTIQNWTIPVGSNIRRASRDHQVLLKLVIRKLLAYKKDDYKRVRGIQRLCGEKETDFLNSTRVNAFEFFYWYRIKANYRDMEFIEAGVPISEFVDFYSAYYLLTLNFYEAFKQAINTISQSKLDDAILKV